MVYNGFILMIKLYTTQRFKDFLEVLSHGAQTR